MVEAQLTVQEHMVLKGTVQERTVQERTVQERTVQERTVQEQMVVQADLEEAAHKMEAGHRVVLWLERPMDHM